MTHMLPAERRPPCQLATACVPWSDDGVFLEPLFRDHVRDLRQAGLEHLYIFGTAGEGHAVTDAQFRAIAAVFFDATRDLPGLRQLGVIGLSSGQARARIEIGLELGFREFQISLPCWGALNNRELAHFFQDTLTPYPQARFLHYNTIRGGRVLTGADYARLAADHPNLVATKSGGHTAASLRSLQEQAPMLCHFLTELDFVAASLLGDACGLLVSVSAIHPPSSRALFSAGQRGDAATLRRLNAEISVIRTQVIALVQRAGGHMDGAFDKIYVKLHDARFPLTLLAPYQGADQAVFAEFRDWLTREYPHWTAFPKSGNPA